MSDERFNSGCYETTETLLAVDLRDNSVQEFETPENLAYSFENYSFTKYKNNQIIKFGGSRCRNVLDRLFLITIESFQRILYSESSNLSLLKAFSVKYEELQTNFKLKRNYHTTQIYQDCLYIYGGKDEYYEEDPLLSELWSFNLSKIFSFPYFQKIDTSTWKLCEPFGEGPGPRERASSLLVDDNLIIYGGRNNESNDPKMKDFFILNMSHSFTQSKIFKLKIFQ